METPSHARRQLKVSDEDRERVEQLFRQPETTERDIAIEAVLTKYFGQLITTEPVPEGHMHEGKVHEGIEIHFRPGARARGEALPIIGGCSVVIRPPTDPDAGMCYRDPPGVCQLC